MSLGYRSTAYVFTGIPPDSLKANLLSYMSKKKKKSSKSNTSLSKTNPPDSQVVYKGPVSLPKQMEAAHTDTVQLYQVTIITSSAAGLVNAVIGNNPAGFAEWSDFQALWTEYRVLAVEYTYEPNYQNVQGTIVFAPCCVVWNRYNPTALPGLSGAYQNESCETGTLGKKYHRIIRMHDTMDAQYRSTNPGNTDIWWMKFYSAGNSNNTAYGVVYEKALVQLRGRL